MTFIVPGIIMMIVIQETFSNVSETIIHMKQQGTFNDILMSPISRQEIAISFLIAILLIGLMVATINLLIISFFIEIHLNNLLRFIFYLSLSSILFGSIGCIIGFISYTWDVQQGFFSFIIAPISLLSGTFFSVEVIEKNWQNFFLANPFYHLVSNLRKSFLIESSYNFYIDAMLIILVFLVIYVTIYIFKKGYRVID
jgi:ABC-2 type transport system permease protein